MITEIIKVVDTLSEAKDVEREVIFEAIENALESTTKKKYTENMDVKVIIDRESGDYKTYRRWMVFADDSRELEDPDYELRMLDAVDVDATSHSKGAVGTSPQPGRLSKRDGITYQNEHEYLHMCQDRAQHGYNSGMGEIFRKVAAISPISSF